MRLADGRASRSLQEESTASGTPWGEPMVRLVVARLSVATSPWCGTVGRERRPTTAVHGCRIQQAWRVCLLLLNARCNDSKL